MIFQFRPWSLASRQMTTLALLASLGAASVCCWQASPSLAASLTTSATTTEPKSTATLITQDQGIWHYQLPSGQQVFVKPNPAQPIITVDTWVPTGSVNETADNNGVSHFLEHLLFKGTPQLAPGEIDRQVEGMGAVFNAATSQDFTHYYITLATPYLKPILAIHADMLTQASIPTVELDKERKVVQEEINRAMDNPMRKQMIALHEAMYPGHGYALDTLGPKALIGTIPREAILSYYHHWYQPQHFLTVVSGDVTPEAAVAAVQDAFDTAWQRRLNNTPLTAPNSVYTPPAVSAVQALPTQQVVVLTDPNASQAYLTLGFLAPAVEARKATKALDLAMHTLGNGRSARLYRELKERQQLVDDVDAGNATQRYAGLGYFSLNTSTEKLDKAFIALLGQLNAATASSGPSAFTEAELDKVKSQTRKYLDMLNESTNGVASSIGYNVTIGQLSDFTQYAQELAALSPRDVQTAYQAMLDWQHAVVVVTLPEKDSAQVATLKKTLSETLAAQGNVAQATSQAQKSPQDTAVKPTTLPMPTVSTLPNGLTFIQQANPLAKTVAVKLFVRGGRAEEPKPGTARLLARMLMQGTHHRDADTLHHELERQSLSIGVDVLDDALQISAGSLADDYGELMSVLQDVLNAPRWDAERFAREKALLRQAILESQEHPSGLVGDVLQGALYPTHGYGNTGQRVLANLDSITLADVEALWAQWWQPQRTTAVLVGPQSENITSASVVALLPAQSLQTEVTAAKAIPLPAAAQDVRTVKANLSATWIQQAWLTFPPTDPDYPALKVLNAILGTGMSSRLFGSLREQQGLAYVVNSMAPPSALGGRLVMVAGTDPKNERLVRAGFTHNVQRLQRERVGVQELAEAKRKVIGQFALAHETSDEQAFYLGFYQLLGVGAAYDRAFPERINTVTANDVQRVARRVFSTPAVTATVAPTTQAPADSTPPAKIPSALPVRRHS